MRPTRLWVACLVIAAVMAGGLSGCGGGSAARAQAPASSSPSTGFAIDQDFPDPDVLRVGGTFYAYATNSPSANVQLATSRDGKTWSVSASDVLPTLPTWALPGKTWAPDVSAASAGRYLMYVVMASASPALQCIGVAASSSPSGPFKPVGNGPLVCPKGEGGAIDPSTFVDTDGTRYLLWKNDGNCCGLDTWLHMAPLSRDGLALAGPATKLVKQTAGWEGSVVEAPVLVKHGSHYVLFYSANSYAGEAYAIGYATASSATGPYRKHPVPLLSTSSSKGRFTGPGGQDVVTGPDGHDLLVFHSWDPARIYRGMDVLPLTWNGDQPVVGP